jgi:acyl-CoA thioesterase I
MAGVRAGDCSNFLLWHWMRIVFLAGLVALLELGCGGSKNQPAGAPPQHEEAKAAAPRDDRPVIVAFGDSLTAGFGAEPGNSYPDFLQKDLDVAGLKWRVVNAGVSGDTTTDGVNRLGEVLAEKPRVVIVEFGGNDGLRGLPIETTRTNLEQIVSSIANAGAKVVLAGMTLPPNYGPEYIQSFEKIYQDLDAKYKVTRIPFLLEGVATKPELMQRDKLHPTAQGNAIVAQTVLHYLKPLLNLDR